MAVATSAHGQNAKCHPLGWCVGMCVGMCVGILSGHQDPAKVMFLGGSIAYEEALPLGAAFTASGIAFKSIATVGGGKVTGPFSKFTWQKLPEGINAAKSMLPAGCRALHELAPRQAGEYPPAFQAGSPSVLGKRRVGCRLGLPRLLTAQLERRTTSFGRSMTSGLGRRRSLGAFGSGHWA